MRGYKDNSRCKRYLSYCVLVLALTLSACSGSAATRALDVRELSNLIAKVGDEVILEEELERAAQMELKSLDQKIYEIKRNVLENLVEEKLWMIEARTRGMSVEELKKFVVRDIDQDGKALRDDGAPEVAPVSGRGLPELTAEQKRAFRMQSFLVFLANKYPVRLYLKPPRHVISVDEQSVWGSPKAPVTIVEVSDFQCPYCARVQPTLQRVREVYGGKVRFAFKHFPLGFHKDARGAHLASLCAEEQGKFWEYRKTLFANQRDLTKPALVAHAETLGLDLQAFGGCLDEERYADRIDQDFEEAQKLGVTGTPTFFINGRRISGAQPFVAFKQIIEEELKL